MSKCVTIIAAWITSFMNHHSMVLVKVLPYTKMFSWTLLKIVEKGMFQREKFKFSTSLLG